MATDTVVEPSPLEFLQLVGDTQRWQILVHLSRGDRRVAELAGLMERAPNVVSYHLGELRSAGLVSARRSAADGRDTYYRLDPTRCGELLATVGTALHPALRVTPNPPSPAEMTRGKKPQVLFLCTGNSARSQMAEALLEQRSEQTITARSAGSHPKPLHPNAVRVMAERGIDIADHKTKHLDRFAHTRFDHVVTLCDKVKEVCPSLPGQPVTAHWSMADPAASSADDQASYPTFVRTADDIEARIDLLIAELITERSNERRTS